MDEADVRHLPVIDDAQRALGYVTRRDVRNALAKGGSCADVLRPFAVSAAFDEHLRIVLSRMYQHNTRLAARGGRRWCLPRRSHAGVDCRLPELGALARQRAGDSAAGIVAGHHAEFGAGAAAA